MITLNFAFLAMLPTLILAQSSETTDPAIQCKIQCENNNQSCLANATTDEAKAACANDAASCTQKCAAIPAPQQQQPPQPQQTAQQTDPRAECLSQCSVKENECKTNNPALKDEYVECIKAFVTPCKAQCPGGDQTQQFVQQQGGGQAGFGSNDCIQKCQSLTCQNENKNVCMQQQQSCMKQCPPPQQGFGGQFPGQQGQFPGGQFGGGQQGGFDDKHAQQLMIRVKKQLKSVAKNLGRISAKISQVEKNGITVPQELKDAVAKLDGIIDKIDAAGSPDELADLSQEMNDAAQVIQEQLPDLERLSQINLIYRRIDKTIKQLDRNLASDQKSAKTSKIDLTSEIDAFQKSIDDIKTSYADAKAKFIAGQIDEGFSQLEDEVFGAFDGAFEHHANIQQIRRLPTAISQIKRIIRNFQQAIAKLKKKGMDTVDLAQQLADAQGKVDELAKLAASGQADPEEVFQLLQDLQDIQDQVQAQLDEINGVQQHDDVDQGVTHQGFEVPDLGFGGGTGGSGFGGGPPAGQQGGFGF